MSFTNNTTRNTKQLRAINKHTNQLFIFYRFYYYFCFLKKYLKFKTKTHQLAQYIPHHIVCHPFNPTVGINTFSVNYLCFATNWVVTVLYTTHFFICEHSYANQNNTHKKIIFKFCFLQKNKNTYTPGPTYVRTTWSIAQSNCICFPLSMSMIPETSGS